MDCRVCKPILVAIYGPYPRKASPDFGMRKSFMGYLSSRISDFRRGKFSFSAAKKHHSTKSGPLSSFEDRDPGSWNYSPEWWGIQNDGWGRNGGEVTFKEYSRFGNGKVVVTAHPASLQSEDADIMFGRQVMNYEWRVLRFNDVTRQSVARVVHFVNDIGKDNIFRQQSSCIAFEYLKSALSTGLTTLSLSASKFASDQITSLNFLCVGLGGGSLPLFLSEEIKGTTVDAVEIDPTVIRAATIAMGFPSWAVTKLGSECNHKVEVDEIWGSLPGRLHVYEANGRDFVSGQLLNGWGKSASRFYDLVFIDAYDGEDNVPSELCDPNGAFLQSLSEILHPGHGVVVVNLHGNLPPPSMFEKLFGRKGPGYNPREKKGHTLLETCRSYKDVLLERKMGLAFTVTTRNQGNVMLVISRGNFPITGHKNTRYSSVEKTSFDKILQGEHQQAISKMLQREAEIVQNKLSVPFSMKQRCSFGLHLVEDVSFAFNEGLL